MMTFSTATMGKASVSCAVFNSIQRLAVNCGFGNYDGQYKGNFCITGRANGQLVSVVDDDVPTDAFKFETTADGGNHASMASDGWFEGRRCRFTFDFYQQGWTGQIAWKVQAYLPSDTQGAPSGPILFGSGLAGDGGRITPSSGNVWIVMPQATTVPVSPGA